MQPKVFKITLAMMSWWEEFSDWPHELFIRKDTQQAAHLTLYL